MYDIRSTTALKDGEDREFILFVDTVERGYRDLARMKVESELSNTTVMSIRYLFMDFLIKQRRIIEYESADIRMSTMGISGRTNYIGQSSQEKVDGSNTRPPRCLIHATNTHTTQESKERKVTTRKGHLAQRKKSMLVLSSIQP